MEGAEIAALSSSVVRRKVPGWCRHWRADLAGEVALLLWERALAGRATEGRTFLLGQAINRLFGQAGGKRRDHQFSLVEFEEGRALADGMRVDDHALAFFRLQQVWPELTDTQREALTLYLSGFDTGEASRKIHVGTSTIFYATKSAIERLADPTKFARSGRTRRMRRACRCSTCQEVGHTTTHCPTRREPLVRLSPEQMIEAKQLRKAGASIAQLTRHFGVSRHLIYRACGER